METFSNSPAESLGMDTSSGPSPDRSLPTGVVTFLLSDVEGSTRLWQGDEAAMGAAIARHYELLDVAITLHGGVRPVEQGEGDSVVGAFADPTAALAAALDAQRAFADEPWSAGRELRIRIALHTGRAQLRGAGNYVGRAVIRCARLRAVAHGGQTLLSAAARDLVADRMPDGASLRDLGVHRLKDLGVPERVWQLCHPDLPAEFPALRSLDAFANNLPTQLTSFVGRESELAEIGQALREARLVTLTGAGGSGKTRLALHTAAGATEHHSDGAWWVELAPVATPEGVPYAVLRTFGLVEEEDRPPTTTLCEQLVGHQALVVLDNAEHVLQSCAELVEALLSAAPRLRVLVTSREPLGIPAEVIWRVPSLDEDTGTRLFVERAAQVRPGFNPQGPDAEAVAQICHRLDGLPLAIELAAARIRMMSPTRIAAALDDRFRLLTGGGRTSMARQRTLETSVAWSHDLLSDSERALLRRLSVFAGGFTLEAAEDVCSDELIDRYAVLDLLGNLVDKSLVQADVDDPDGRCRLLETIRFFARNKLIEAGEIDSAAQRHLEHFVSLAERAEPELMKAEGLAWLDRLQREWDNLNSAVEWCAATQARDTLLHLLTSLTLFFELRSHLAVGGRWFAHALEGDDDPSVLRARALWGAAHVALYGGDFEAWARHSPAALAMAEESGDEGALCRALNINGLSIAWIGSQPAEGRAMLERSAEIGRRLGDDWALADGLKLATVTWMFQEDHAGLAPALAEFEKVADQLGNRFFPAWHRTTLGWVAMRRGEFTRANAELELALEEDRQLGGAATGGVVVAFLADIEAATGEPDAAEARLVPFLSRAAATGDFLCAPWGIPTLARIQIGRGDPAEARKTIAPFVEMMRPLGMPLNVSEGLHVLAAAQLALGDLGGALASAGEARTLAESIGNGWLTAHAVHLLGEVARQRGEYGQAEDLHHRALTLRVAGGFRPGIAESLEALAGLAATGEGSAEAARLFGAAATHSAAMGLVRRSAETPRYETDVATARAALGSEAFAVAWAEGESLSLPDVVAYATRARGERKRPSSGWASLTPVELDVVRLAATGLTNPAIGEKLFIAPGTVKTHLKHVFTKVGVSTRAELAAEATRRSV